MCEIRHLYAMDYTGCVADVYTYSDVSDAKSALKSLCNMAEKGVFDLYAAVAASSEDHSYKFLGNTTKDLNKPQKNLEHFDDFTCYGMARGTSSRGTAVCISFKHFKDVPGSPYLLTISANEGRRRVTASLADRIRAIS